MPILVAPGQAESGFLGLLLAPYRLFLNAAVVAEEGRVEGAVRREEALAVSPR